MKNEKLKGTHDNFFKFLDRCTLIGFVAAVVAIALSLLFHFFIHDLS
jgi:hypothetical protein